MKRKLWLLVLLAFVIGLAWCGTAVADGPAFTKQPVGGTIVPDGGREISWTTNFTPVKVVIGYCYYSTGGFGSSSGWNFVQKKSIENELQSSMKTAITYAIATTSEKWAVRAYYNDTQYEESSYFSIDVVSRQFTVSPTGGTVDPDGSLTLSWETNFKPVKIEIGREIESGYDWFLKKYTSVTFVRDVALSSDLKKKMSYPLSYENAKSSDRWYIHAYYDDDLYVSSQCFTVTVTGRAFTTQPEGGEAQIQGTRKFSWATNFTPTKIEILHSWTVTTQDWFNPHIQYTNTYDEIIEELSGSATSYSCHALDGIVVRAYYHDSGYVDSARFFITEPEGQFTKQPQGGASAAGDTLNVSWATDFTPDKVEFISLSANNNQTVIDTWEGASAAHETGSYPFPAVQGDQVNARYIIRATYRNGSGVEKTVTSDSFYVRSSSADYRFTTQPQDCYAVDMHWSSVTWAVNFQPEKVEYLCGSGSDVSEYSVSQFLYASETDRYAIRCYYSVTDDLYCVSDTFTVTYYQDVWTKQPEGGTYVRGTKFHLTWGLQFTPETIILRYCTPEGHPITQVPQFEMDPSKSYYDMEIESGNSSQYYNIWAWLDDSHSVVSDPFRVQMLEDYIFVQEPQDITVPDSGSNNLNWVTGFRPVKTEVYEFAIGDPDQALHVTELDNPEQNTFEVTADGTNRERGFVVRAWYTATEYVDSRLAIATQELIERIFTKQPKGGSIPVNGEYTLTWLTNFTPVRTEIWRGGYSDGEATNPALYLMLDNPTAGNCTLQNDSPAQLFGYEVRAYYSDTNYISSSAAAVYHERNYLFIRQPWIRSVSSDGKTVSVDWKVDFSPVRAEVILNDQVMDTLAAGVMTYDFTKSENEYFIRVYYDEVGYIESDLFGVSFVTITIKLGYGDNQGPYYEYLMKGSVYQLPKCMFYSPISSGWRGHFVDWRVGPEQIHYPVGTSIIVNENIEIKGTWKTGSYTITFHKPMTGAYPDECLQDVDPETGLLTYTWPWLVYAHYSGSDPVIRPSNGQLPDWSGYGPAPVNLYWDLVEHLDENYVEQKWASTSQNTAYTVYEKKRPDFRQFSPSTAGFVYKVDAYPVFGWRSYATYNANGGTGSMPSDEFEVAMGDDAKDYTVRANSFTAPNRSAGTAPSYYDFDGWLLNGKAVSPGTVLRAYNTDLPFVARWRDKYESAGYYLYGVFDGDAIGCSESASSLGILFTEAGDDTWKARVNSENGCHVSVKYYNGYYNESLWYNASPSGDVASLTLGEATENTAAMVEIPAGTYLLTLTRSGDSYVLNYEETDAAWCINGDVTGWESQDMMPNPDGTYSFSAEIDPNTSWSGTFEFSLVLNDDEYTASAIIFDSIDGLSLVPREGEDGEFNWDNIRIAASGCGTYTFTLNPADMTLTVTNDLSSPGAFLMGFMGDYPIRMTDPASGDPGMGEGGGSEPPVNPYHFSSGTTLWASASISGGEWLEEGPTFYIGSDGQTWGTSSVSVNTTMTLSQGGRCPVWVDEDFGSADFDFYYCPETHQLMIQKHINSHQLTLYTWNAAEERPMSEVTDSYSDDTAAFTIAPDSAVHYQEDWDDVPFVYDGDTIVITAPDYPGYRVVAWYPCSVSMWWSSSDTGFNLNLYEEKSLGSGNTLEYTVGDEYGTIELTAVYEAGEPELVSIVFDAQGGAPKPDAQTILSSETVTEPTAPTMIGAVFTGWYTDKACTAETLFSFDSPVTKNITLYAGWLVPAPAGILKLPAALTEIDADAFQGIAAEAVIIPPTVTSINGNPFAGSSVQYIYGYPGSAAETLARNNSFIFVTIDDAWIASH